MNALASIPSTNDASVFAASMPNLIQLLAGFYPGDRAMLGVGNVLAQVTVVLAIVSLISCTLFRRRPADRCAVWLGVLLCVAASPLVTMSADRLGWTLLWLPIAPGSELAESSVNELESSAEVTAPGTSNATQMRVGPGAEFDSRSDSNRPVGDSNASAGSGDFADRTVSRASEGEVPVPGPVTEKPRGFEKAGSGGFQLPTQITWRAVAVGSLITWLTGSIWLLTRLAIGVRNTGRMLRRARPLTADRLTTEASEVRGMLGLHRMPPILESPDVVAPAVAGLLRPRVLLPDKIAESLHSDCLRDVLVHECAHVVRRDPMVGIAQRIVELVFWPHPLVHYMNRELALAREEVCDNHVLRRGDPRRYSHTLLQLAERISARPREAVMGLFDWRPNLEQRIAGLLSGSRPVQIRVSRIPCIATALVLIATSLATASLRFTSDPNIAVGRVVGSFEPTPNAKTDDGDLAAAPDLMDESAEDDPTKASITGIVVGEAGDPVAGATVRLLRLDSTISVRTEADGRFKMILDKPTVSVPTLLASAAAGKLQGIERLESGTYYAASTDCRITVRPTRELAAIVRNRDGQPIPGATVQVMDHYSPLADASADSAGRVVFQVPTDAQIWTVFAFKSGVGFDYFENYRTIPIREPLPLPDEINVVLDGAQSARLRVVDSANNPVAGIGLYPWYIKKPGKLDHANISGCRTTMARTNDQGIVEFDWLPDSLQTDVTFWIHAVGFSAAERSIFKSHVADPLVVHALRDTHATGTVTLPDGSPARGIMVDAIGQTQRHETVGRHARTRDDGTYSLELASNTCYAIGVRSEEWASPIVFALDVNEGETKEGLDFRLSTGVLIEGVVTEGHEKKPAAGRSIFMNASTPDGLKSKFMVPDGPRMWRMPTFHFSATSDAEGHYRLRVPTGRFELTGPDRLRAPLQVEAGKRIERNFHVAGPDRRAITGTVRAKHLDGKPVAGAIVRGESIHGHERGRGFEAVADEEGRFRSERWATPMIIYARSTDGSLAGFATIGPFEMDETVEISPAGSLNGRVVDRAGAPVPGRRVQLRMSTSKVWDNAASFPMHLVTDADGRFSSGGLVVGAHCELAVHHSDDSDFGEVSVREQPVNGPDPIRLADIVVPGRQPPPGPGAARPPSDGLERKMISTRPSRGELEALLRAIGRDEVNAALIDRAALLFRPQFAWRYDRAYVARVHPNAPLVKRIDAISQELYGRHPDSLKVLSIALTYLAGYDDAALRQDFEEKAVRDAERGPTVRGTVIDAESHEPVAGALVYTRDSVVRTGQNGEFELALHSRPRDGLVWIEADGRALAAISSKTIEGFGQRVELVRDQPIVGQILDANDKPIAGATAGTIVLVWSLRRDVTGDRPESDNYGFPFSVLTDGEGYFAIRGLPPMKSPLSVTFSHDKHQSNALFADNERMTVTLQPGCAVDGLVVDEQGTPVPDASVQIRSPEGRGGFLRSCSTDEQGKFGFGDLSPGRWLVVVQPERHAPVHSVVVATRSGVHNQYVLPGGGYILGKVIDSDGTPVARAHVGWVVPVAHNDEPKSELGLNRFTATAADGRFRIGPLPLGRFQLTGLAQSPRRLGQTIADANQTDVVIRIVPSER
jgi:beta-lactamase regulating signal transducer with metallopeptidase domain/protocatechuate 3,4-dioxygenase beta subunit